MFEKREKITLKPKNVINVKFGDQTIKVKPWLETGEVAYIVDESCAHFKDLIMSGEQDTVVLLSALSKMNMLITLLATNIDMEDLDVEDIGSAGIFSIIQEKVLNYNIIRDAVVAGMNMIGSGLIIDQLSNIASIDDLSQTEKKIEEFMGDDENSERVKSLIEVMLANNPAIAKSLNETLENEGGNDNGDKK